LGFFTFPAARGTRDRGAYRTGRVKLQWRRRAGAGQIGFASRKAIA
jgi:hypothetical protein